MIRTYRKKPMAIRAIQITDENMSSVALWCKGHISPGKPEMAQPDCITLPTFEGIRNAYSGDWIIRDESGEFYPCKDMVFKEIYYEDPNDS